MKVNIALFAVAGAFLLLALIDESRARAHLPLAIIFLILTAAKLGRSRGI